MIRATKLAAFLRSLPVGTILYSPLCGYVKVFDVNDSGIVVSLPDGHDPDFSDTLLFRDNGHLANHERDDDGEYQIFPSRICRNWRFLRFKEDDVIVMEFEYTYGNVAKYTMLYKGVDASGEWYIHAEYVVYGDCDAFSDLDTLSFQPIQWEEQKLSFRFAHEEEARHLLSVMKAHGADLKAQAQVAAHIQDIKLLEQINRQCNCE